ncbi:transposase [[Anoxybacillus] calidus]|uniref:transposase n=1 Tax=[Anoxybacillus] calidus TaxID=575178 RepID=UPI0031B5D6ED
MPFCSGSCHCISIYCFFTIRLSECLLHVEQNEQIKYEHEERLTLVFVPPPNLNLIERIWGRLKDSVIANRFHANRKELRESIVSFLEYLSEFPEKVLQRIGQVVMSEN